MPIKLASPFILLAEYFHIALIAPEFYFSITHLTGSLELSGKLISLLNNLRETFLAVRLKISTIILQLFCLSSFSYSQTQSIKVTFTDDIEFEHLTVNDGLSQNNIWCIFQDSKGFMWFGTENGLNKYDGYEFRVYQHDPKSQNSISDSYVTAIAEDETANLWIGTENGLNRLNPYTGKISRFFHDPQNPNSLSNNKVREICIDTEGTIWIGTENGLNQLKIAQDKDNQDLFFRHYYHNPANLASLSNNDVTAIYEDRSGNIWIGTIQGLNKLNKDKESFTRLYPGSENIDSLLDLDNGVSSNRIYAIYEDYDEYLWIGVWNEGFYGFDKKTKRFDKYEGRRIGYVHSIIEDSSGTLWMGMLQNRGLSKFDKRRNNSFNYRKDLNNKKGISSNGVTELYVDRSGIIWIGTMVGGINKIDPYKKQFLHYEHNLSNQNSLSENKVWSIYEDSYGKVWIATSGKGVDVLVPESNHFINYTRNTNEPVMEEKSTGLSWPWVISVFEDKEANMWIGTTVGLNRFDRKKQIFHRYFGNRNGRLNIRQLSSDYIFCISEDNYSNLWIGTGEGLNKYDKKHGLFTHYFHEPNDQNSIGSSLIECLYLDKQGTLWVGANGLNKYVSDKDYFIRYKHNPSDPFSLSHNHVISICEDNSGIMWIGTQGGGLNKFDRRTERFLNLTTTDGLPDNTICGILEDQNGNLWVSTRKGLSKFNPKILSFRNYDKSDGLQSDEFSLWSYHKGKSGRFYFGGINGFNMFYPDSIKDNPYIPPVVITALKVSDQQMPIDPYKGKDKRLRLAHNRNDLSFEFVALNYTNSHKNQYAYKLEGIDEDWVDSKDRRFARYADVPPGDYTFKVKGSNNDGIWNEEGASLKITILPPWWETWLAFTIYAALILGTLYGLRRYELSRQRFKHNLELKNVEAEKFLELDKMKSRFFANISHEFRTPLTLIKGPIERWLPKIEQPEMRQDFEMTQRNTNRLLRLVNQLLDISRLESGKMKLQARPENIVELTRQLTMAFDSLASVNDIELRFTGPEEPVTVYLDRELYEKIITNLLFNALKFTPEGGKVIVDLSLRGDMAEARSTWQSRLDGGNEIASSRLVGRRVDSSRIRKDSTNTDFVQIEVTDTGAGIPADHLPHIFDRFYQVSDSYTKDAQGSGIGLALTKELVELHHGEIEVSSEVAKGTEFTIRLPLGKEHLKAEEILPPLKGEHKGDVISDIGFQERIQEETEIPLDKKPVSSEDVPILLIVEDNPDMRSYIHEMLVESYKVIQAADGQDGFEKAAEIIPDIIISDVMMPEMDGFQFCERIKTDERTSHIPVILLTAKSSGESKVEGLETGADDYLIKPFDSTELRVRVKNLIEQRRKLRERFRQEITLEPKEIAITSADAQFLKKVMDAIEQQIESEFGVAELSTEIGMSRSQLHRKLRALTDQSPVEFIRTIKLKRAAALLEQHSGNISEVAYQVGFNNPAYFAECFRKLFGVSPKKYASQVKD